MIVTLCPKIKEKICGQRCVIKLFRTTWEQPAKPEPPSVKFPDWNAHNNINGNKCFSINANDEWALTANKKVKWEREQWCDFPRSLKVEQRAIKVYRPRISHFKKESKSYSSGISWATTAHSTPRRLVPCRRSPGWPSQCRCSEADQWFSRHVPNSWSTTFSAAAESCDRARMMTSGRQVRNPETWAFHRDTTTTTATMTKATPACSTITASVVVIIPESQ